MKRLHVAIDVSNIYHCVKTAYDSKLDYEKLIKYLEDLGETYVAYAYGAQKKREASSFISCLKRLHIVPKFKKPKVYTVKGVMRHKISWDVGLTIDTVRSVLSGKIDMVVLLSSNSALKDLVVWVREQGIDVVVMGTNISHDLKEAATEFIEIPDILLETVKDTPVD